MEQVQKMFDTDTLFQNQKFMTKTTRNGNTKHLVKESDGEHYKGLCGQRLCLGTPQTLTNQAEEGINRNHPKHYKHKVCRNCRNLFEKKTGRTPREDIQKYSGGENPQ